MQEIKQEKSLIKQNISLYLAKKGVSEYSYYKDSGTTRGILGQNNGISEDNITRFLAYAPDINIEWLLTGKGNMLKSDGNLQQESSEKQMIPTDNPQEGIPLIPVSAMAGALRGEVSVRDYECERYIVPVFRDADFLIQVRGNSMVPTYQSGDIVACRRTPMTSIFFQWNKPYVLDTAQGAIIKRIKPGSDKQHVLIVSDNADYDPFELPLTEIYSVALVLGFIRPE